MNTRGNDNIIVKQVNVKRWAGGIFPALYDASMKNNVIPKKFGASFNMHNMIIRNELSNADGKLLELAAGSGSLAGLINCSIDYSGVDVSLGLLKLAAKKFRTEGFDKFRLFNCGAEQLPFDNFEFDYCVCNLSLNFFSDITKAIGEAARVMKPGAVFVGSVPVPERNERDSLIRGTLHSEAELAQLFSAAGFNFEPLDVNNGALLYFRAVKC